MQLFLSHAQADVYLAQALRIRLEELSPEIRCFLLADDMFAGEDWEQCIRTAAARCDGVVSIVTENYVNRPWFVAEWAVFWFQEKPWYVLLHGVDLTGLFEPMRRRQAFPLNDRRLIQRFLRTLVGPSYTGPLDIVANELKQAIAQAEMAQADATAEANLARLAVSLERGTVDVDRTVVESIRRANRLTEAVKFAAGTDNSVALRQFAWFLVQLGEIDAAAMLARRIPNLAERRTVGVACLTRLADTPRDEPTRNLLLEIYETVRNPQRRDLRRAADERSVSVAWPDLPSTP
jgi:TIR domain